MAVLGILAISVTGAKAQDPPNKVYLPIVLKAGETPPDNIDYSALSLPVREIRATIPNGKEESRFGIIGRRPDGILEPPATPIQVRLLTNKAPRLNEAINVTLQIHAFEDASGTNAMIELPQGAVKVLRGATQISFDLVAGQRVELTATVVFRQAGEHVIVGRALKMVSPELIWGDMDALYLSMGPDIAVAGYNSGDKAQISAAQASSDAPNLLNEETPLTEEGPLSIEGMTDEAASMDGAELLDDENVMREENLLEEQRKPESLAPPPSEAQESDISAAATVTISICWILGSDRDGSTPPLRDALIQLWDQDSSSGNDLLASGFTGYTNGCSSFTLSNTDTDECCTIDVYFKVFLYHVGRYRVQTYGGAIYNAQTTTRFNITSNFNFGTWWMGGGSGNDRSVRIYNDLYRLRRFVDEQAVVGGMGNHSGQVTVRWQTGGTDGTYYSLSDKLVHLADADASSRDVVVHEAAHRYMDSIYTTFPPNDCPSPHIITAVSGRYCAWSEGYTYVLVAAADGNPVYTFSSGAIANLETPNCNSVGWADGPQVEGRVGGLLIDLIDPFTISFGNVNGFNNEGTACGGDDATSGLFDAIWDLLYDQDDKLIVTQSGDTNSFSNAWEGRQYPRYAPHRVGHLNSIGAFTHD
jgi:hypothetical protein